MDLAFLQHMVAPNRGEQAVRLGFDDALTQMQVVDAVHKHQAAVTARALLSLPFTSVDEYFYMLKLVAEAVAPWKERALFLLAAAVSDFYIPQRDLSEHKIQSRAGPLTLTLQQVPKLLGVLRRQWAPHAFVVSFKLETDWELLRRKAHQALDKYAMHLVVANELHTRFDQVLLLTAGGDERVLERPKDHADIEASLIDAVAGMHFKFIATQDVSVPDDAGFAVPAGSRPWRRRLPPTLQSALSTVEQHREEILGVVLGGLLSVLINMAQAQLRRSRS